MNILIGADLVPTASNFSVFKAGDGVSLVGEELLNILNKADYRIFNLEVPLCDNAAPIEKCGPALIASTYTISGYNALGVDLLTLANNHIMDQDNQGLISTINLLNGNGIAYLGAGETLEQAKKPYNFQLDGKKIGVYACAEHEFSIADDKAPGANPFDPFESLDHIAEMKGECDYAIVLYHGGKEHYRYPSPSLQNCSLLFPVYPTFYALVFLMRPNRRVILRISACNASVSSPSFSLQRQLVPMVEGLFMRLLLSLPR